MQVDVDQPRVNFDNFVVAKERLNLGTVEVQRLPFKDGQIMLVTVDDRNGGRVSLPIINLKKFERLGISNVLKKETSQEELDYFDKALEKMSYLMAVHATFNCHPRPDLNEFPTPDNGRIIPIVAFDGPPHCGKTIFATSLAVLEPDENWGIRDFDPFSYESLDNSVADVKAAFANDPESIGSFSLMKECIKQFDAKRELGIKQDTSHLTLKDKLDKLLEELKSPNHRMCYILDLPGLDQDTPTVDVFHLLAAAIPLVDFANAMKPGMTPERLQKIPIIDRWGYFNHLRRRILPLKIYKDDPDEKLLALAMMGHEIVQYHLQYPQLN